MALLGAEVLVGTWSLGPAPVPDDGYIPTALSVGTDGGGAVSSGGKTNQQTYGAASLALPICLPPLIKELEIVLIFCLALGVGGRLV